MSAQEKLIQVLDYIKEAEGLLRKPVFTVSAEHFCRWENELRGMEGVTFNLATEGEQVWLRVERFVETKPPALPFDLQNWVTLSRSLDKEPVLKESIPRQSLFPVNPDSDVSEEKLLEDNPELKLLFDKYVKSNWRPWSVKEKIRRRTITLYNNLFALQQLIESESTETPLELVWGTGIMLWAAPGKQVIRHPLLSQLCEINVNEKDYALEVRPRNAEPMLEVDPLVGNGVQGIVTVEEAWRKFISKQEITVSPFDSSSFECVLNIATATLDAAGQYWPKVNPDPEDKSLPKSREDLIITDSWVLFARKRTGSLVIQDIERLKAKLEALATLPEGLGILVEKPSDEVTSIAPPSYRGVSCGVEPAPGVEPKELYFPKPYNDEQVAIIQKLDTTEGVVVQGPPGTGKTHTIANAICHYLAQGKRVLVTSHGEPALAVLQDQIPEEIRPLAVSLLTSERDGMKQFEHAINTIASSVSQINEHEYNVQITAIRNKIDELHQKISVADHQISKWAEKHLTKVKFQDREILPEELAKYVTEHAGEFAWFTDPLRSIPEHQPKFTGEDIDSLRAARIRLKQDLAYLDRNVPAADDFPDSLSVLRTHRDLARATVLDGEIHKNGLPQLANSTQETLQLAESLAGMLDDALALYDGIEARGHAWSAGLRESYHKAADQSVSLLESVMEHILKLEDVRRTYVANPVSVPDGADLDDEIIEAVSRLTEGKSPFGLFGIGKAEAKAKLAQVTVVGSNLKLSQESQSDWATVSSYIQFLKQIRATASRWNAAANECGLPILNDLSLSAIKPMAEFVSHIHEIKHLAQHFDKELPELISKVFADSFDERKLFEGREPLAYLKDVLSQHLSKHRLSHAHAERDLICGKLAGRNGVIVDRMKDFVDSLLGNPGLPDAAIQGQWSDLLAELRRVNALRSDLQEVDRVSSLIKESGAKEWASRLITKHADDTDPETPFEWREAWTWRRAKSFIEDIDRRGELKKLYQERTEAERDLSKSYRQLVAKLTWLGVYRNSSPSVKSALQKYLNAVRNIGAGTGIRAVRYRRDARDAMNIANSAVPCWIMPHWRVSEMLPAEIGVFDLVIVDEASQSDLWAFPSLLRGKKLLVVGDDKQVSPEGIGLQEAKIKELLARFLTQQAHGTEMTPEKSLYDLSKAVFAGNLVMLREHFRCVEPIISFSNREFYSGQIRPLRLPKASERLSPPLVDVLVTGGYRPGREKINKPEAHAIVDEIKAILADPQMDNRSIGVVSLLGSEQAHFIFQLLEQEVGQEAIIGRKITCGDAKVFQGKERDIMMLSMVHDRDSARSVTARMYEQRFNVAASRARDRMYLFRSVEAEDLNPNDLKAKLISHFRQPFQNAPERVKDLRGRCESGFERDVYDELTARGYRVVPQVIVGAFRIDMVVEGENDRRLAIECDGDQYHGPGQWLSDASRQRVLERAGWTFWRCFASSFALDREGCLADLLVTMQRMGIEAIGSLEMVPNHYTEHRVYEPKFPYDETDQIEQEAPKEAAIAEPVPAIKPTPPASSVSVTPASVKQVEPAPAEEDEQWEPTEDWIDLYAARLINELAKHKSLTVESKVIPNETKQTVALLAMDGIAIIDKDLSSIMRKLVDKGILAFDVYGPGPRLIRLNRIPSLGAFFGMHRAEKAFRQAHT